MRIFEEGSLGSFFRKKYVAHITVFIAYFAVSYINNKLFVAPAVVFPAVGVGLAALVVGGIRLWPSIYFASILTYVFIGTSPIVILLLPIANSFTAISGALFLKKFRFDPVLRHLRDVLALLAVTFIISPIIPTAGIFAHYLEVKYLDLNLISITWGSLWMGILFSLVTVAPLVIRWIARPDFTRTHHEVVELITAFMFLAATCILVFWTPVTQILGVSSIYFILAPLMWMALRVGPRFMTVAFFLMATLAIGGVLYRFGGNPVELGIRLLQIEIFVTILTYIFFILVSIEEERSNAVRSLKSHVSNLEGTLDRISSQNRAKSEFIAVLAHELRNPLAPIVSGMELLKLKGGIDEETTKSLTVMEGMVNTIRRLLDDLLDISRISTKKLRLKRSRVDLCEIVRQSVESVEPDIKARNQRLVSHIPKKPIMLYADRVRIEQIVMNLLSNASKYSDQNDSITISVDTKSDVAEVRVLDNGIGIEPHMIGKIFEPFLQAELGDRSGQGLGIGLSLSQSLATIHGGTVRAESTGKGRGSEFILELPLLTPEEESLLLSAEGSMGVEQVVEAGASTNILIVDDNIPAAEGIGTLLTMKNHKISYAHTGAEAIKKIMKSRPSVVILDIGLPDIDGYSVVKEVREKGYRGMVIALTGYGQDEDKEKARRAGFDDHLTKPVGLKEIELSLARLASKLNM